MIIGKTRGGRRSVVAKRRAPVDPVPVERRLDAWGDLGDSRRTMQAVKARFDPHGTLSPGRGPVEFRGSMVPTRGADTMRNSETFGTL